MRQTPVSVPLTILMLLLVLTAAFLFVLQGRNQLIFERSSLVDQVATMESMLGLSGTELEDAKLEMTVQAGQKNDVKATVVHTNDYLTIQRQTISAYEQSVAQQKATITAQEIALSTSIPSVEVIQPQNSDLFQVGHPIKFLASVVDKEGLTSVELYVNGVSLRRYSAESPLAQRQIVEATWITEKEGRFTFDFVATNQRGNRNQQTVIVEVLDLKTRLQPTIDEISQQVSVLRGLPLRSPIRWRILSQSDLQSEWENRFATEYTPQTLRELRLKLYALDAISLNDDFQTTLLNSYSSLITGYYDLKDQELVVISNDQELSPAEKSTLAHEIVHALQQQAFGAVFDSAESLNSDAKLALRALIEGDATITAGLFEKSDYFSDAERQSILNEGLSKSNTTLPILPTLFLKEQFFPYYEGRNFVQQLYDQGGFVPINRAWITPPSSTEQILTVEAYNKKDSPQVVALPTITSTLGADWELISKDVLGEFTLKNYLNQANLNSAELNQAIAGWEGDRYTLYWNEKDQDILFVLKTIWNTPQDIAEFVQIYAMYAIQKFGINGTISEGTQCWTGQYATCIYSLADQAVVVRAPNIGLIEKISADLNLPVTQP